MASLGNSRVQASRPGTYTPAEGFGLATAAMARTSPELASAADYSIQVLQVNRIPFALMGGFSMKLRGSRRTTHDVDIAVGCNMLRLKSVMTRQKR